ncbi:MAG: hypothetical protein JMJ93_05130 [Synergistaceae bacterium]|nr:hypothetical protein [Synergistaceae bacterium]
MNAIEGRLRPLIDYIRGNRQAQRLALFAVLGLLLWMTAFHIFGQLSDLRSRMNLQEDRFRRLAQVVHKYRNEPQQEAARAPVGDVLSALSSLIDQVGIKERLVQLSTSSGGATLQLERLYGEELATLLQEMDRRGLPLLSAELRSVPYGEARLFACSLLVGGERR